MKNNIARFAFYLLFVQMLSLAAATPSQAYVSFGLGFSIGVRPPLLPVYVQPAMPGDGYIWIPGYWAWDDEFNDYYWVPGTWSLPPSPGLLWTPGYWGWNNNLYAWYPGYWGNTVGYYGGINYGFGYSGIGYSGGYWRRGRFYNNRIVNNVNVIHDSFTRSRPSASQIAAIRNGVAPSGALRQHFSSARQLASSNTSAFRASVNHGRPGVAATAAPGRFNSGFVKTRDAREYTPSVHNNAAMRAQPQMRSPVTTQPRTNYRAPNPSTSWRASQPKVNYREREPTMRQHSNPGTSYRPQVRTFNQPSHQMNAPYARPQSPAPRNSGSRPHQGKPY